jgi:hypothetical protein
MPVHLLASGNRGKGLVFSGEKAVVSRATLGHLRSALALKSRPWNP